MRLRTLLTALIPICIVLLIVAALIAGNPGFSASAQSRNGPISHLTQPIHVVSGPSTGFSAIQPHLHPTNPNAPTYTAADVEKYIIAAGSPSGPLVPGAQMTFKKILFLTAGQVALLPLGDGTNYPSNAPICYVLLDGPFYPLNRREYYNPQGPPKPVQYTIAIFDGVTGNFLYWGIPSRDINWYSFFKDWTPN